MYIHFYGLTKEPFQTTPDVDFLFLSPSHKEALASIIYGIQQKKGFIAITGEVGVGKTTILRSYLETADRKQKTIYLYNPKVTFARVLITILNGLGVEPVSGEAAAMVSQLHELLMAEHHAGGMVVLVVDEAQNMPVETLEAIRMLSNLETSKEKLIQIVLVGQPELEVSLKRHELRQVRERIAVRANILPLTKNESVAYIEHRLAHAGNERAIFSSDALKLIVTTACGIPRRLNILCDNALITGFGYQQSMISRKIAKEVIADIDGQWAPVFWRSRYAVTLVAIFGLALFLILYLSFGMKVPWGSISVASPDRNRLHQDVINESSAREDKAPIEPDAVISQQEASRIAAMGKEPAKAGSGRVGEKDKEPVLAGSGQGKKARLGAPGDREGEVSGEKDKEPVLAGSGRAGGEAVMKTSTSSEIVTAEKAELSETARLLTVLLDSGRVVLGKVQPTINNPRLEDKGFSSSVFETQLRKEFLTRTGHDLRNLAPSAMPERAKPLLVRLSFFMQKAVQEVQPLINKKGIGFKGFIPATFATKVAESFSKDTGLKLRQIGPPGMAPRNPNNKADEQEEQALLAIEKSHPRVGDHVVEQQLPDDGVRVLLPLFYNKQCLACHGKPKGALDISGYEKEGFKEGDLGGAVSIILPADNKSLQGERDG